MTWLTVLSVALAIAGTIASFFLGKNLRRTQRHNETLARQITASQQTIKKNQAEIDNLSACMRARLDGIGSESKAELTKYLGNLSCEIEGQINALASSVRASQNPLVIAREEAESTRIMQRQERFLSYKSSLENSQSSIKKYLDLLSADMDVLNEFVDRINSGRMDPAMGRLELRAIEHVIAQLANEDCQVLREEILTKQRNNEIQRMWEFKDKMYEVEVRQREQEILNPKRHRAAVEPDSQ